MPRIPDLIVNCSIYLYPDLHDAEGGSDLGGSGFLLSMPSWTKKGTHCYAITCRHVILGNSTVVRVNLLPSSNGRERTFCMEFSREDWICHPEYDLAVCPLPYDADVRQYATCFISRDFVLTRDQFESKDVGPGDDLLYVGRFMGHAGRFQNMPSVRFGSISMNPCEDEPIEYDDPETGERKKQTAFLVEARSRSGYSGSPVYLISPIPKSNPRFLTTMLGELRLLGIDFMHIPERVTLADPRGYLHGSKWQVEVHAGMMGVIPSWFLLDFIDSTPRLVEQRRRDDERYATWEPNATPEG